MSAPSLPSLLVAHWQPVWSLDVAAAAAVAAVYLSAARRVSVPWPLRRTASFVGGIAVVLLALESGIGTYDDALLSVHMVQHMLLLLLAPLMLLGGQPMLLALAALPPRRRPAAGRALRRLRTVTHPLACVGLFTIVLLASHLPAFYDATVRHPLLHDGEHVAYLIAGLVMWWPLLGADPAPGRRLGGVGRIVYMLGTMPSMALVGAYLTRAPTVVYAPYRSAGRALGVGPLVDQAHAGAIMWVAGTLVMSAAGLWAFAAALIAEERRMAAREATEREHALGGAT